MNVKLINADEVKLLFNKWGEVACKCYDTNPKYAEKVGKHCLKSGHFSGSRGIYFFFDISGISRNCSLQLNRHETGVFKNQASQRYINMSDFGYYIPPRIAKNEKARQLYCEYIENGRNVYQKLTELLNEDGFKGEKANEESRYILSGATYTQGVWGFTLEALINFCHKRLCVRSQKEIRDLANAMKSEVIKIIPELEEYLVPQCKYLLWCPESKKDSCGKYPTKQQLEERID